MIVIFCSTVSMKMTRQVQLHSMVFPDEVEEGPPMDAVRGVKRTNHTEESHKADAEGDQQWTTLMS
jgi:hypothetical protein